MEIIKNDLSLRFCIWDFEDITETEITKTLNLKPLKVYVRGNQVNENISKISKRNGWIYGFPYRSGKNFQEQINEILDVLEPKIYILKNYSQKYNCEFSCALFLNNREQSVPWIHFDKRYNAFIKEVDVEFDIDIYYPPLD